MLTVRHEDTLKFGGLISHLELLKSVEQEELKYQPYFYLSVEEVMKIRAL